MPSTVADRVRVVCPGCRWGYRLPAQRLGRSANCLRCGVSWTPGGEDAEPPPDPRVGQVLGQYRLTRLIARGPGGDLFEAYDDLLQRAVAVKLLPEDRAADPDGLRQLVLEAREAARIRHPNVLTIQQIGVDKGTHFVVAELVDGGSAADYLVALGRMDVMEAARVVADSARGLQAAHRVGIIHRNLKPGNVLCGSEGLVKIADFGLETVNPVGIRVPVGGRKMSSTLYMSPEHFRNEVLDPRSDVYSLGAVWYALLTGKPPFPAGSFAQAARLHEEAPVPDPRKLRTGVTEAAADIVRRCLSKDPDDRYGSMDDLLDALEAAGLTKTQPGSESVLWKDFISAVMNPVEDQGSIDLLPELGRGTDSGQREIEALGDTDNAGTEYEFEELITAPPQSGADPAARGTGPETGAGLRADAGAAAGLPERRSRADATDPRRTATGAGAGRRIETTGPRRAETTGPRRAETTGPRRAEVDDRSGDRVSKGVLAPDSLRSGGSSSCNVALPGDGEAPSVVGGEGDVRSRHNTGAPPSEPRPHGSAAGQPDPHAADRHTGPAPARPAGSAAESNPSLPWAEPDPGTFTGAPASAVSEPGIARPTELPPAAEPPFAIAPGLSSELSTVLPAGASQSPAGASQSPAGASRPSPREVDTARIPGLARDAGDRDAAARPSTELPPADAHPPVRTPVADEHTRDSVLVPARKSASGKLPVTAVTRAASARATVGGRVTGRLSGKLAVQGVPSGETVAAPPARYSGWLIPVAFSAVGAGLAVAVWLHTHGRGEDPALSPADPAKVSHKDDHRNDGSDPAAPGKAGTKPAVKPAGGEGESPVVTPLPKRDPAIEGELDRLADLADLAERGGLSTEAMAKLVTDFAALSARSRGTRYEAEIHRRNDAIRRLAEMLARPRPE